jgi:hypothetical protein
MIKYKINYINQIGGKQFDYLYYRILNNFIKNKSKTLEIINSFENGLNYLNPENRDELIRLLQENNIASIDQIIELINKINNSLLANVYLTTYDKFYFNSKDYYLSHQEIQNKINAIPNILTNMKDYIEYIFRIRYSNFENDKYIYIKEQIKLLISRPRNEFEEFSKKNKEKDQYLLQISKLEEKIEEIKGNQIQLSGRFELNDNDVIEFISDNIIDLNELNKLILKEKISIRFPPDADMDSERSFLLLTNVKTSEITIQFKIIIHKNPETVRLFTERLTSLNKITLISPAIISINSINNSIRTKRRDYQRVIDKINNDYQPFIRDYEIAGETYNYGSIKRRIYESMQEVSRRAVDIGDNIEDKYLFLSLNKICLDIPEISMKSIRIFTNVYIYQTIIRQRDGKEINKLLGELDLIVADNLNNIVAIGEIKAYTDGIQKAYSQLINLTNFLTQKFINNDDNYFFTTNKDRSGEITFNNISDNLKSNITNNPNNPEEINEFYIILKDNNIINIDPHRGITQLISIIFIKNMVDLIDDRFVIKDDIAPGTYNTLQDWVYQDLLDNGQKMLTTQIILRYLGKNNLIIFKENITELISIEKVLKDYII